MLAALRSFLLQRGCKEGKGVAVLLRMPVEGFAGLGCLDGLRLGSFSVEGSASEVDVGGSPRNSAAGAE